MTHFFSSASSIAILAIVLLVVVISAGLVVYTFVSTRAPQEPRKARKQRDTTSLGSKHFVPTISRRATMRKVRLTPAHVVEAAPETRVDDLHFSDIFAPKRF